MRTIRSYQQGLLGSSTGKQAMAMLAQVARKRLGGQGSASEQDALVSWETVSEFGSFRITVRCDYAVEQTAGAVALADGNGARWQAE